MAKDFSKNSNLSFRVVGGAMRRDLVSPGLAWRRLRYRRAMEARREKKRAQFIAKMDALQNEGAA